LALNENLGGCTDASRRVTAAFCRRVRSNTLYSIVLPQGAVEYALGGYLSKTNVLMKYALRKSEEAVFEFVFQLNKSMFSGSNELVMIFSIMLNSLSRQINNFRISVWRLCELALLVCIIPFAVSAQSSVFNTPSTDTQPEKTLYLEGDFYAHFDSFREGGFHAYSPVIVYGIRKNLEIGVNLLYVRTEGEATAELQPNIKWKFYENNESGVAASTGAIAFIPLNKATGTQPSAMFYANISKTFKSANEMRLTGGVYTVAGTEHDFGSKNGFTVGLEQPITSKFTILADWSSGNNRFGYSTVGASYQVTQKQIFGVGYSFGNVGRGNNYFTAFYGLTF
jgi:hypothetical protein